MGRIEGRKVKEGRVEGQKEGRKEERKDTCVDV